MALNKLAFHNVLVQEMDAPSSTAEKLADLVDEANDELATKHDLALTEARLREDIAKLEANVRNEISLLLKWLIGLGIVLGGALVGLLAALVARI